MLRLIAEDSSLYRHMERAGQPAKRQLGFQIEPPGLEERVEPGHELLVRFRIVGDWGNLRGGVALASFKVPHEHEGADCEQGERGPDCDDPGLQVRTAAERRHSEDHVSER